MPGRCPPDCTASEILISHDNYVFPHATLFTWRSLALITWQYTGIVCEPAAQHLSLDALSPASLQQCSQNKIGSTACCAVLCWLHSSLLHCTVLCCPAQCFVALHSSLLPCTTLMHATKLGMMWCIGTDIKLLQMQDLEEQHAQRVSATHERTAAQVNLAVTQQQL